MKGQQFGATEHIPRLEDVGRSLRYVQVVPTGRAPSRRKDTRKAVDVALTQAYGVSGRESVLGGFTVQQARPLLFRSSRSLLFVHPEWRGRERDDSMSNLRKDGRERRYNFGQRRDEQRTARDPRLWGYFQRPDVRARLGIRRKEDWEARE